ncbi:hypothetical protein [Flavobacterium sp.]|uniref:hypothetical protein n=1 Tax=Flavobacterium sp. TaxID=239 RepID=UPI002ED946F4
MLQKTLLICAISLAFTVNNEILAQQIQRFRLGSQTEREVLSSGKEREISTEVWLDRVNTLELQPSNMILSIDDNVFVFKIISKAVVGVNKIKYIVTVPGTESTSEVWQANYPTRTIFEVHKNKTYLIRYFCTKI